MHPSRRIAALPIVLALALGACAQEEVVAPGLAEVEAGEVVEVVSAAAEIAAPDTRSVTVPVGGEVVELLVEDGQRVDAGDVVARLDAASIDLRRAELDASLTRARATVQDLTEAIARFDAIDLDTRYETLWAIEDEIENAIIADQTTLRRQLEADRDRLIAELESRPKLVRDLEAARATVRQLELSRRDLLAGNEDFEVTSPIAGTILLAPASAASAAVSAAVPGAVASDDVLGVGSLVTPGQAIATVLDDSGYVVLADVDEIDAVLVEVGQAVIVTVDALPGVELDARVTSVALQPVREATGGATYETRIEFSGLPSDVRLLLGLTASVDIVVRTVASETLVPTTALVRRGGREVVYVVREGIAVEVPVEVVVFGEDVAAVEGELARGERVVVSGLDAVEAGTVVEDVADADAGQG